jgi:hypothetical protein
MLPFCILIYLVIVLPLCLVLWSALILAKESDERAK